MSSTADKAGKLKMKLIGNCGKTCLFPVTSLTRNSRIFTRRFEAEVWFRHESKRVTSLDYRQ